MVSRGGRPDLAGARLAKVLAPTLLIVGGKDRHVLELNRQALAALTCEKLLRIVPDAGHLFEEPGALEAGFVTEGQADRTIHALVDTSARTAQRSAIAVMLADYVVMREQASACGSL